MATKQAVGLRSILISAVVFIVLLLIIGTLNQQLGRSVLATAGVIALLTAIMSISAQDVPAEPEDGHAYHVLNRQPFPVKYGNDSSAFLLLHPSGQPLTVVTLNAEIKLNEGLPLNMARVFRKENGHWRVECNLSGEMAMTAVA